MDFILYVSMYISFSVLLWKALSAGLLLCCSLTDLKQRSCEWNPRTIANIEDPDEMPQSVAIHRDIHCLLSEVETHYIPYNP